MKRALPFGILAAVLLLAIGLQSLQDSAATGYEAADFTLPDLSGREHKLSELRGKIVFLNLWATWCPPCRRELPMLAEEAANSDIPILLANQGEDRQAVADYLLASGISPRSVVLDKQMGLMDVAGNGVLPTTIFVDAEGEIVATHVGEISRAALSDKLQQLQGD